MNMAWTLKFLAQLNNINIFLKFRDAGTEFNPYIWKKDRAQIVKFMAQLSTYTMYMIGIIFEMKFEY